MSDNKHFDLIIIGGGIYGTATLWEASHRGLNCLLLEKNDFCSGTSCNSLKTIHGGLRYLQQFNLKRAIESDQEKVILKTIAPHLIEPLSYCLATQNKTTKSVPSFYLASLFFNCLTKLTPLGSGRHKTLFKAARLGTNQAIFKQVPDSKKDYLIWQDAQALNTEQLGLAYINSAIKLGATAKNYHHVTNIAKQKQYQVSAVSSVTSDGQSEHYVADIIIDCTNNPDAHHCQNIIKTPEQNYVSAINLVLDQSFSDYAFALPSKIKHLEKQGMLFINPWRNTTLAGTWYFNHQQVPNKQTITSEIINDCLDDLATALFAQGIELSRQQLKSSLLDLHFGILPSEPNIDNPEKSLISHCITDDNKEGYYRLRGNKYTTARRNAKKLIDNIARKNKKISASQSHCLALIDNTSSIEQDRLVTGSRQIYQSEVDYFCGDTLVKTLPDLLYRRLNINHHLPIANETIDWCCQRLAQTKQWSAETTEKNRQQVIAIEQYKQQLSHAD